MDPVKTEFGKYATELFTEEAEAIIASHDVSQVRNLSLNCDVRFGDLHLSASIRALGIRVNSVYM